MTTQTLTVQDLDLSQFVFASNDDIKTTSLLVAEKFGKLHKDVLKKIESLECSAEFIERNFAPIEIDVKVGFGIKKSPAFEMTKDGFMFLVMGFTGKAAAQIKEAYINAFNLMHAKLFQKQPTPNPLPNALSEILSANLTPVKKMVMLTIIDKADQNGQFQIGILELANLCGIAKSTIVETVSSLESLGFLTITRTRHRTGGSLPNTYTIPERFRFSTGGAIEVKQHDWINQPVESAPQPAFSIPNNMVMISAERYREMEQSSLELQFADLKHIVEQSGGLVLMKCEVDRMKGVLKA